MEYFEDWLLLLINGIETFLKQTKMKCPYYSKNINGLNLQLAQLLDVLVSSLTSNQIPFDSKKLSRPT